ICPLIYHVKLSPVTYCPKLNDSVLPSHIATEVLVRTGGAGRAFISRKLVAFVVMEEATTLILYFVPAVPDGCNVSELDVPDTFTDGEAAKFPSSLESCAV